METPNIKELEDFTFKGYTKLLPYLAQIYKIVPFCDISQKDVPYLILRHDIDVSIHAALKMAQIERDLEIKSTYFVMFSNRFYNVLEGDNVDILKRISKLGHEIGLHYHPFQFRSYNRNVNKTLEIEIQLLEHLLGRKVYSIARHGYWDRDPFATIKEYINANHPYLRGDLFIHDSCRTWTPPQGLLKLLNDHPRRVQLLTHPENWQEDKIDRDALRERSLQSLEKELRIGLDKWLKTPSISNYDQTMRKGNSAQFYGGKLAQELGYYNTLFKWHLINTSLGWRFHQTIEKIRAALKK